MIVYELACALHHRFEGWFASGGDFDRQAASGLLECPQCGSADVRRLPSARVQVAGSAQPEQPSLPAEAPTPAGSAERVLVARAAALRALVHHIVTTTEDVGREFAAEARRIHYEEAPARSIRGVATADEARELVDEGVPVVPLPVLLPEDLH